MRNKIKSFLSEEYNSGLMIVGDWGIGKTHYVLDLLRNINHHGRFDSQSYVSLLGVKKIKDVETNIHDNIKYFNKDGFANLLKDTLKIDSKIKFKNLSFNIANLVPNRLNKTIIILDDLERKHKKLKTTDLIALAHRITQNCSCKFIIISNKNKLDDEINTDLITFDKIFSNIINYNPSLDNIYKSACALYTKNHSVNEKTKISFSKFKTIINENNIRNIRILYKMIVHYCNYLELKPQESISYYDDYFIFISYLFNIGKINSSLHSELEIERKIEEHIKENDSNLATVMARNYIKSKTYLKSRINLRITLEIIDYLSEKKDDNKKSEIKIKLNELHDENTQLKNTDDVNRIVNTIICSVKKISDHDIEILAKTEGYELEFHNLKNLITIYGNDKRLACFFKGTIIKFIEGINFECNKMSINDFYSSSRISKIKNDVHLLINTVSENTELTDCLEYLKSLKVEPMKKPIQPEEDNIPEFKNAMDYIIQAYTGSGFYFNYDNGPFLLRLRNDRLMDTSYFSKANIIIGNIDHKNIASKLFENQDNFDIIKSFYINIFLNDFNIENFIESEQFETESENENYNNNLNKLKDIENTIKIIKAKFNQIFTDDPTLESRIKIHIA